MDYNRTLNLGAGNDQWGTDRLDIKKVDPSIKLFDLNSGKKLPYENDLFSEIKLWGLMEYLSNPQFILNECYRVAKKGCLIKVDTPNISSMRFFLRPFGDRYRKHYYGDLKRMGFFDMHTLTNRIKLAGFDILYEECQSRLPPFRDWLHVVGEKNTTTSY